MKPELFQLFDVGFPAYFVLLLSGFMFATAAGVLWARSVGENPDVIVDLGIGMLLVGVIGGRILHVLADGYFWDYVHMCTDPSRVDWPLEQAECLSPAYEGVWDAAKSVCHPKEADCFAWAKFWSGGLTYYGGFLGASVAAWYLLKRDRFPFWKAADMAAFAVALGLVFGRIGCFLGGCCFGTRTDAPWGISFPPMSPASEMQAKTHELASSHLASHPVHPTQLYEAAASFAIFAVCLFVIEPKKRFDGQVFAAFVALYAAARFGIEFLRDDARGGFLSLSTSQLIGLALLPVAAAIYVLRRRANVEPQ